LETLTIVINAAPYGDERLYNALRLARALVSAAVGVKVNVFLLGDAVVAAKKGQKTPEGYPNFEEILWELIKKRRRGCGMQHLCQRKGACLRKHK
jgi:uncharacterized protein involved in oxidation of intracellular sulfur